MTSTVDTSFMESYYNNDMSREELFSMIGLDRKSVIMDNLEEFKSFIKNLAKLTWVIKNYYQNATNDNRKIIGEMIELYLIYYFNNIRAHYKKCDQELISKLNDKLNKKDYTKNPVR